MENRYYFHLTDEEIEQFESDESIKQDLIYEVEEWIIENYPNHRFYIIDATSNDQSLTFVMDEFGETGHTNYNSYFSPHTCALHKNVLSLQNTFNNLNLYL